VAVIFMTGVYVGGEIRIFQTIRSLNFLVLRSGGSSDQAPNPQPKEPKQNLPAYDNLEEYLAQIDYSCQQDEDCVVKDVSNCCGYYPQCVNIRAETNPVFVRSACVAEGLSGICGFPSVSDCRCLEGRCQGF